MLVNDSPVFDPTNSVIPPEGSILPMNIKVESDSGNVNELETKPDILRLSVETNKIGGYVENTSEGFTDEFSIKSENIDATSKEEDDNNSEGYFVKTVMQFDNEDSDESGMGFVRSANVESNQRSFSGERPYKCPFCPKTFITSTRLKEHKRIHTGERPYGSTYCSESYIINSRLQKHMFSHKKEERKTEGPYECLECSKTFKSSWALKVHNRVHSQITNAFDSTQSSHQSNNKKEEVLLVPMHTKEKRFSCHTKEKPYICSECGKGFVTSSGLNRHKRIHIGVKPYVCTYCSKSFTSKFYLKTHIREEEETSNQSNTHTEKDLIASSRQNAEGISEGSRQYVCGCCSNNFKSGRDLRIHVREHKMEEMPQIGIGTYACQYY